MSSSGLVKGTVLLSSRVSSYCVIDVTVLSDVRGDRSDPDGSGGERLPQTNLTCLLRCLNQYS